jgi:hypothetical protein
MRGYSTKARVERMASDRRAELTGGAQEIIVAARRALVDVIERQAGAVPRLDQRALAAVAVSGLFGNLVTSLAATPSGSGIIDIVNQQLAEAGLQLVPVARN